MAHPFCKKILFFIGIIFFSKFCFAAAPNIIYVYDDAGASQESVKQTINTLKESIPSNYSVERINAAEVLKNQWTKHAALFVMPGGAATPYAKKLNGLGNEIIKNYVNNGGSYLGMCAGGYYGSKIIEFDRGGPLEIITTAELSFFPGKAIGPVLAPYNYKNNSGARAALIKLNLPNNKSLTHFYFNGGAYFQNAAAYPNVTVLGFYQTQNRLLPAILKINYGKGVVILSGVHFEYSTKLLDKNDPYLISLLPILQKTEVNRLKFFQSVLKFFGIGE